MDDCLFCKIVKGEIPAYKIYEDEKYLAFLDITPYCEGHTMVIPKKHYRWMWDMPDEEIAEVMKVSKKLATHFKSITGKEEVYTFLFGAMVPHVHYHLLPNVDGHLDGYLSELSEKGRMHPSKEELERSLNQYKL